MDEATLVFLASGTLLSGYGFYLQRRLRRLRAHIAHLNSTEARPPA